MTPSPLPGLLTKKEVAELYGRSHRSLTRDFSSAVRVGDREVLEHLSLQTEDGVVRQGTEVTLEQIQELSNSGLSPTWYVDGDWAARRYGTRTSPAPEPTEKTIHDRSPENERSSGVISNELVRRLEQQIEDLQRDKEKLYTELSIKNEQIQQANERTRESNVLMKELQSLLANVQERALLPLPHRSSDEPSQPSSRPEVIENAVPNRPATIKPSSQKPNTKSRPRAERGSVRPKSQLKPVPAKEGVTKSAPEKPKWFETPTLNRLLRRRP